MICSRFFNWEVVGVFFLGFWFLIIKLYCLSFYFDCRDFDFVVDI